MSQEVIHDMFRRGGGGGGVLRVLVAPERHNHRVGIHLLFFRSNSILQVLDYGGGKTREDTNNQLTPHVTPAYMPTPEV